MFLPSVRLVQPQALTLQSFERAATCTLIQLEHGSSLAPNIDIALTQIEYCITVCGMDSTECDFHGGSLSSGPIPNVHPTNKMSFSLETNTECAERQYPWFALQVRARYEKHIAEMLCGKGYDLFLPLYKCRRRWSNRYKILELPLFPGYLFCRFDFHNRSPILKTPGVIRVLGIARTPVPIGDAEIDAIRTIVGSGLQSQPWPFLQVGTRVRIEYGALCGLEGILLDFRGRHRLIVSVTLLQRSVAVEIDGAWVSGVRNRPFPVAAFRPQSTLTQSNHDTGTVS
jgi:transcription antitermination factor NusG